MNFITFAFINLLFGFLELDDFAEFLGVLVHLKFDTSQLFAVLAGPVCFAGFFVGQFYEIILWHSGKTIPESPFLRNFLYIDFYL